MKLINKTQQKALLQNVQVRNTELGKMKGLLGEKKQKAIIFKTRLGIHTFFMQYAIDVVLLDSSMRVIRIKQSLQSYRVYLWGWKSVTVIELPAGTVRQKGIMVGDMLQYES